MPESAHTRRPLLLRALSVSLILLWLAVAAVGGSTFGLLRFFLIAVLLVTVLALAVPMPRG
ncbi:MAG: hypothetical protein L0L80_11830, partial [Corynebacterium variabile]|nr:hypothetical protein [Corynebacterium variabile]